MGGTTFTPGENYQFSKVSIISTGESMEGICGIYHEFIQKFPALPAPGWLRYHYFSEEGLRVDEKNQITSGDHFTRIRDRTSLLQIQVERLMIEQINEMLKAS